MAVVSHELFSEAISLYSEWGFKMVAVPWIVERKFSMVTCPDEKYLVPTLTGDLVGSAEQAFIQMDHRNELGTGRFMALTPCFRNEAEGEMHHPYFMKLELYSNIDDTADYLMAAAQTFFSAHALPFMDDLSVEETPEGQDITLDGVELGSYGVRQFEHLKWAYGTGLAQPRFSQAIKRLFEVRGIPA